ncbi:J domain-containing protein [Croceicoccus mobilis]|uniref:Molecular chaperone DnaJ n=1 Tax=Croceicoccus mobilis TaxID=1703339 RepID=A0A917DYS4_9SPHN|nr:DnaJ domain-containing protein [Croceicoccus mobilis]GGD79613.1 molecular chaperone DnaJ [Croceicoccus mobilis]
MMGYEQKITDYYEVLKVNPRCDARVLELAYHHFAKMYHPDNRETSDPRKFSEVIEAYRVLRDPQRRSEYDRRYQAGEPRVAAAPDTSGIVDEETAISDGEVHAKILLTLYKRRRENGSDPGMIGWFIQEMLGCSQDIFDFHIWYLKSKGFIEVTEQGTIAVTVDGIDHVINTSKATQAETLMLQEAKLRGS